MTFPAMGILISFPVLFVRGFGLDAYESITGFTLLFLLIVLFVWFLFRTAFICLQKS